MSQAFASVQPGLVHGLRPERSRLPGGSYLESYLQGLICSGRKEKHSLKQFLPILQKIHLRADKLRQLDELSGERTRRKMIARLRGAELTIQSKVEIFAQVYCACENLYSITLHDEQLYAAWLMLHGLLVEMATGEGKTFAAALPTIAVAATRDCQMLSPLYSLFNIQSNSINCAQDESMRRQVYRSAIVHATHKQLAFDYLRDTCAMDSSSDSLNSRLQNLLDTNQATPLMRGLCFAIVDEADSVMIDDARTPLILSESLQVDTEERSQAAIALAVARTLTADIDYQIERSDYNVNLSDEGVAAIDQQTQRLDGMWRYSRFRTELVRQALISLHCYERDVDYLVKQGKLVLIDKSTGHPVPDRRLRFWLHQMVEVKEKLRVSAATQTVADITFQQFFQRYHALAGMSGTLSDIQSELRTVYHKRVVTIPRHAGRCLLELPAQVYSCRDKQFSSLSKMVAACRAVSQPVLIGTRSVERSEQVSQLLSNTGIEHRVLNARQDEEEAAIIASAGMPGTVTVATNMAGRGCDIPLHERSIQAGGLMVISLDMNDSRRIDQQLYGRAARQGQPGATKTLYCLSDPMIARAVSPVWIRPFSKCRRPGWQAGRGRDEQEIET